MIIKINDLKKNLEKKNFLYLLYGSNIGHIEETINNILIPFLTKNVFSYEENEILSHSTDFVQSILNKSFFDNETFNLIGWQTKDIYQNMNITYLSSIQINQKVDKNLFKLPIQN